MSAPTYAFIGEKRSPAAIRMGVTWQDGRLAAKTLHAALAAAGIVPEQQTFLNLFEDGPGTVPNAVSLDEACRLRAAGVQLVGLGRLVQRELDRAGLPHIPLVHPAARGAIRKRERYHAHVAAVLRGAP
jgi:hypothetical protein